MFQTIADSMMIATGMRHFEQADRYVLWRDGDRNRKHRFLPRFGSNTRTRQSASE